MSREPYNAEERAANSAAKWVAIKASYAARLRAMSLVELFFEANENAYGTIWDELCHAEIARRQTLLDQIERVEIIQLVP